MEQLKINNKEKVGSVAIQQALRFYFNLRPYEIAYLCKVSPGTVWQNTIGLSGVIPWEKRTRKSEAITKAIILLNLAVKTYRE